jgi:hypothetical protein
MWVAKPQTLMLAALASSLALPALAQSPQELGKILSPALYGTSFVSASPRFAAGKLFACELEYRALQRDHFYKQGAPIVVFGGISINRVENGTALVLKVVLQDVSLGQGQIQSKPAMPANAYLMTSSGEPNIADLVDKSPSDTPGGLVSIFKLGEKTMQVYADMLERTTATIAFNRTPGGSDLTVPLDLTIVDMDANGYRTKSLSQIGRFSECVQLLIK